MKHEEASLRDFRIVLVQCRACYRHRYIGLQVGETWQERQPTLECSRCGRVGTLALLTAPPGPIDIGTYDSRKEVAVARAYR